MNLGDIIKRVKRTFGDESGVQITDEDITRWANEALVEICIRNELLQARATADMWAGQMEYALPNDFNSMRELRIGGQQIKQIAMQEADASFPGYDDLSLREVSTPVVFWAWSNYFALYPVPDSNKTNGIVMFYTRFPATLVNESDVPEIGLAYHNRILEYCKKQAYELDENYQAAQISTQEFEAGMAVTAEQENKMNDEYYPTITVLEDDRW